MNDRTQIAARPDTAVASSFFSFTPTNLKEAMELAKLMADSELMPKDYRGKPGNVLVAVQMGAEIGLKPMQAIQNIAVINGRPSLWGDALWALVKSSPVCEWTKESFDDSTMTATCTIKRKGEDAVERSFSKTDAEKAKLWGKEGPWQNYPKRMLQMRARGFCARDAIPEALKGFSSAEEARDIPIEKEVQGERVVVEQPTRRPADVLDPNLSPHTQQVDMQTGEIAEEKPAPAEDQGPLERSLPGDLISAEQRRFISIKMQRAALSDADLKTKFGFDLASAPAARVNEILKWTDSPMPG